MKLGRKHAVKPSGVISVILGLTPRCCYKTKTVTHTKIFKCYVLLLSCTVVTSFFYLNFRKHKFIYRSQCMDVLCFLDVLREILGVLNFLITSLGTTFLNMDAWQDLLHLLYNLEGIYLNKKYHTRCSLLKNPNVMIFVGTLYCLVLYSTELVLFYFGAHLYFMAIFTFFVNFVSSIVIYNILSEIKRSYACLNSLLLSCKQDKRFLCKNLEKVGGLYMIISTLVDTFNRMFGWTILGLLSICIVHSLKCSMSVAVAPQDFASFGMAIFISNLLYGAIIWVGPLLIIFICDLAVEEWKNLLVTCQRLEQGFLINSKEYLEVLKLRELIENNAPVFRAAGFIHVNRSTLLCILSTITTYFIVGLQLSE